MSLLAFENAPGPSRILERIPRVAAWRADLVFPPTCGGCGRVDFQFCQVCTDELTNLPVEFHLQSVESVDAIYATGTHEGVLADAIRAFKYEGAPQLASPLAARLATLFSTQLCPVDVLIPVPLSAERLAERGYNQSELLGESLSAACLLPCRPNLLGRVRHTGKQAQLKGEMRQANVKDAFVADDDVQDLSVLLIDDVVTTGSTLRECALALRDKGATAVYALAVSHGR